MAAAKPLPFDRVRVIVDVHTGQVRRPDERRTLPAARPAPQAAWRPPAAQAASGPSAAVVAAFTAALYGHADVCDDTVDAAWADRAATTREAARPVAPPSDEAGSPDHPAPAAPDDPVVTAPPMQQRVVSLAGRAGGAAGDTEAAVPIAAIARSVQEATAMHAVAALVLDTCSGEGKRETGPWEFTLGLHGQGLGRTSLLLRLSRELLSLRFSCDGPDTRDLLSRHSASLLDQLQTQLQPPLVVDIVLIDA